jgi:GntR family transcriptional regulator, transcriptional repressor for pyruvate dehydrogenase complex
MYGWSNRVVERHQRPDCRAEHSCGGCVFLEIGVDPVDDALNAITVRKQRVSEQVADQIESVIVEGTLLPGDKLPAERILAGRLGVSRTAIREALKVLQQRGLVRSVGGSGSYVSRASPEAIARTVAALVTQSRHSFSELVSVRRALESEITELAATHATREDLDNLAQAIEAMRAASPGEGQPTELDEYQRAHLMFHRRLAHASGNSLLEALFLPTLELILEYSQVTGRFGPHALDIQDHADILAAVHEGDPRAARAAMTRHMAHAAEWLVSHPGDES